MIIWIYGSIHDQPCYISTRRILVCVLCYKTSSLLRSESRCVFLLVFWFDNTQMHKHTAHSELRPVDWHHKHHRLISPFSKIPQDVPTFPRPIRKTKVLNDSFNWFVYKFYPQSILILEEYLLKWWNANLI